ncbi:MAG: hypothetical protein CMH36_09005 [Microbacterium sp.]|uniref:hypothetical protein n=1 Tax=Microbacterium sp. 4NA327F11 TaxID=2502229 RepID=UPI000C997823|nr:hypothetical protein [Microbacterium sp. 4NA327F11]MAL06950.1 hypothetical protein [Microbacterium sp.]MCK9917269.1 hypothetical protein [Microbacteriaceae bacterium K1510]|tara:strand:- start:733 stop:1317 length:585 start_codon:yes stop_codon:yes gene_type:complete
MTEINDAAKVAIITSAAQIAGKGASPDEVAGEVSRILDLLAEGSPAQRAFDRSAQRSAATVDTKGFAGTILWVDKETTSQRPIVFLRTAPSEHHPDGIEIVRMDRLDSQEGESAKHLARRATELIGHRVGVSVAVEKAGGKNVRILRSIEDRGVDSDAQGLTLADGWRHIPWGDANYAKIAPKLERLNRHLQPA